METPLKGEGSDGEMIPLCSTPRGLRHSEERSAARGTIDSLSASTLCCIVTAALCFNHLHPA